MAEWRRLLRSGGCIAVTECSWLTGARPLERRIGEFTGLYRGDGAVKAFTDSLREEIRCYREFGSYYGYVFYIGQKPGF